MPRLAFTFDLDTVAMRDAGMSKSDITTVYQREAPAALAELGFTLSPEGSVYCTEPLSSGEIIMMTVDFSIRLQMRAPRFCKFVRSAHLFQMDDTMADVTTRLRGIANF